MQKERSDALTDFEFDRFYPGRRIPVNLDELKLKLEFGVFNELLDQGEVYVKELEDLNAETKSPRSHNAMPGTGRKRKAEDTLKVKNPCWARPGGIC